MKIAVVGAGLSGLAFCWHYQKANPTHKLTLFDPKEIPLRTSSLANLLYPFAGMRAKLNWRGFEALKESEALLNEVSIFCKKPIYKKTALLKIPSNSKERDAFYLAAQKHSSLFWKEETPLNKPGLFFDPIIQVDGVQYLEALFNSCSSMNVKYQKEAFTKEHEKHFDLTIICKGYDAHDNFTKEISYLKGQALILKWPSHDFKLPHCLIFEGLHLIPSIDSKSLYVGNTFERSYESFDPCLKSAKNLLWQKLLSLYPKMNENLIIEVKAGVRLTAPNRLPKIGKIHEKKWIFTALGSKGLLYHSYLAKILTKAIENNSLKNIPQNVLFDSESTK